MQVEATCTVTITSSHVEKFIKECDDVFSLFWILRTIAIDEAKMRELREFFTDRPECAPVLNALQGLADALENMRASAPDTKGR